MAQSAQCAWVVDTRINLASKMAPTEGVEATNAWGQVLGLHRVFDFGSKLDWDDGVSKHALGFGQNAGGRPPQLRRRCKQPSRCLWNDAVALEAVPQLRRAAEPRLAAWISGLDVNEGRKPAGRAGRLELRRRACELVERRRPAALL